MAVVNSAYDARFQSSFKSVSGRDWWVTIYDRNWTSAGALFAPPYLFKITDNGLNIQYDCEGDEKFAPIVGSKLKLNFLVDYADTSEQQGDFIDDLLGYGPNGPYLEGDLFILVREGSSTGNVIFCGEYLQDLDTLPDVSGPFPIQLTFTDGIGKLKETTWDSQNIDTTLESYSEMGYKSFSYWISQCLLQTNFYKTPVNPNGFWDGPSNKTGFFTSCRWYNSDMYYKPNNINLYGDVLMQTQGTTKWANKFNPSNGQLNIASCYDVLKQICKSWGMRVIAWQSAWYIYQIEQYKWTNSQSGGFSNEWQNPLDGIRYQYKADGTPTHRRSSLGFRKFDRFNNYMYNLDAPGARTQKLQGGSYKFLPVLKEVKLNLVHEGFQNVFGGIPQENGYGTNGNLLIGGPFLNSLQFKFETNLHITITTPSGSNLTSWNLTQFGIRIIAMPPGSTTIANALATLEYDSSNQSYGWDDTPTYIGFDLGPIVNHYTVGGPYPSGTSQTVPLSPKLKFPGYRDAATDYMIILASPVYLSNQVGTLISASNGFPYSSSYAWTYANPIDTSALNPPSWSTGFFNQYLSTIQPVSSLSSTANTIFVNTQTDDSHKLDWGDVYWGDGPEYWDDSALRIRTGFSNYEFSDWTSQDWGYKNGYQTTNPVAGSGKQFTEQLAMTMKYAQSSVLKRANFKLADSPDQTTYGGWDVMVNPVGNIRDITRTSTNGITDIRFFFRRGSFNMIMNEWDGEWIEATYVVPTVSPNYLYKMAGGSNLNGPGNTLAGALSSGSNTSAQPRLSLLRSTENVVGGTAISSITIQVNRGELIDGETDFLLNVDYRIMTGDKVWMVYDNGTKYELTVTADVADNSTSLSFTEFTPEYSSPTPPLIQIPMLKVWENMNRKTSGSIAGFVVTADDLTKDGISIDGFLDSDTMTGASATTLPTSESVKAYVDNSHPAEDQTLQEVTDNGNTTTNAITFAGGTSTAQLYGTSIQLGSGTTNERIRVYYSDGSYMTMRGYGLEMERSVSYIRPNITNSRHLRIGNTSLNWAEINAYAITHKWLNGTAEKMRITSAGKVGIGTTSPSQTLDVSGNVIIRPSGTTDTISFLSLGSSQSRILTTNNLAIWPGGSESVRFLSNGNVGIGTTAPISTLDVNGTISLSGETENKLYKATTSPANGTVTNTTVLYGRQIDLYALDDIVLRTGTSASDDIIFFAGNSEKARIKGSGNVGIGTTSPGVKLDVDGQIRSDDSFLLQSGTTAIGSIRNQGGALDIRGDSTRDVSLGSVTSPQALFVEGTNGNVGIGTTAPTSKLTISGVANGDNFAEFKNASNIVKAKIGLTSNSSGELTLIDGNNVSNVLLSSRGNVNSYLNAGNFGIGTTSPTTKLDVVGTGKFTGQVTIPATPVATTDAASKSYVDAQSSTAMSVFSMLTCSTTTITSASDGVANAVVMKFDTESITSGPATAIVVYGSGGIEGIENSQFCWVNTSSTSLRYFELQWNVTSDTNTVTNRVLSGIRIEEGILEETTLSWSEISPTTSYIYDRGSGNIKKGSTAGSILISMPVGELKRYYRMVFWKEKASNNSVKSESVLNGTQMTIKQLQ